MIVDTHPLYGLRLIIPPPSSIVVGIIISDTVDIQWDIGVYGVSDYR